MDDTDGRRRVAVLALALVVALAAMLIGFFPGTNDDAVSLSSTSDDGSGDGSDADTGEAGASATATPDDSTADDQGSGTTTATDDGDTDGASGDENDVAGTDTPESGDAVAATIAHRVERGDTLIAIGAQYGVDWQLIAQLNQITDPNVIGVGRVLQVPNPDATGEVTLPAQTTDLEALFDSWAESTGVPTELLQAVAWYESEWDPTLLGPAGELGIGQLLPEVHTFVERDLAQRTLDPSVPADSVEAMARYLGWLLTETQGDTSATLAAYHQGLLSQRNIGWNDDTIAYIAAVVSLRPQFVDRA